MAVHCHIFSYIFFIQLVQINDLLPINILFVVWICKLILPSDHPHRPNTSVANFPITGKLSFPTELKKRSLLHRLPHVCLMAVERVSRFFWCVITQHNTRVVL